MADVSVTSVSADFQYFKWYGCMAVNIDQF